MTEDKYLRVKQVCERTGLSRPTIYNMMKAGTFPIKTALGERAVAWLESEIVSWMETRKAFEKSVQESRPGHLREDSKARKSALSKSKKLAAVGIPLPQETASKIKSEPDDWGQDDPSPTGAEMNEVRSHLVALSRKLASPRRPKTSQPKKH